MVLMLSTLYACFHSFLVYGDGSLMKVGSRRQVSPAGTAFHLGPKTSFEGLS